MRTFNALRSAAALGIVAALRVSGGPAAGQSYFATDLGTLPGGFTSAGFGLNDFGRAVGVATAADANLHGFYWSGGLTDIPPLTVDHLSQAYGVNNAGQVAAVSFDLGEMTLRGLIWQNGSAVNIGNIAPRGINAAGVVVGFISTNVANFGWVDHAALYQNSTLYDLGTLGGNFSYAAAIADDNRIVGWSTTAGDAMQHATLWRNLSPIDLGTLGGASSQAYDLSNAGHVVGVSSTAAGQSHAFLFTVDASGAVTSRTDLGTLAGGYSYAYGVNSAGDVVGTSGGHAFVWAGGPMVDLNTQLVPASAWRLDAAWAVNDCGLIVGGGYYEGQPRAFLLTPNRAGDANCDGQVNFADIDYFVAAIPDNQAAWATLYATRHAGAAPPCSFLNCDVNGDGHVNFADIDPFVALIPSTCP